MISKFTKTELKRLKTAYNKGPDTSTKFSRLLTKPIYSKLVSSNKIIKIPPKGRQKAARYFFSVEFQKKLESIQLPEEPKTKKSTKGKKPRESGGLAEINLEEEVMKFIGPKFEAIEQRLSIIESSLDINSTPTIKVSMSIPSYEFQRILKEIYDKININERRGGMVPIPKLWDSLKKQNVSRTQFEDELFTLEKKEIIELQTASDPKLIKEREKSIQHPSRGLINYVIWRR